MSFRDKTWQDIAALDEHLTVFLKLDEALERFLEDFGFSSHEAYEIVTGSGIEMAAKCTGTPSRSSVRQCSK